MVQQAPRPTCRPNSPTGVFVSRQLDILTDKRARQITSICMSPVGASSTGWWRSASARWSSARTMAGNKQIGLGGAPTRTFVFIPHARFIEMLRYKAELVGIQVIVTEESYTSKCSFLDLEPVSKHDAYAGKRVKRGLFRASDGRCLNADVNGAYNILRKVVPNAFGNGIGGVVVHPVRIALMNGPHGRNVHVA